MSKSLSPETISKYAVKWGPIGEPVYKRSYSRVKEDGSKETYPETVVRAVDGNIGLVDKKFIEEGEREKLIELLLEFAAIPAGRHLYASGVKGRQFLFNCHAAGWDAKAPWDHFGFLFDELMQGGGVGSNYSNRYMQSLPSIERSVDLHVVCRPDHPNIEEFQDLLCRVTQGDVNAHSNVFKVPDTREGWVEAVEHILRAAWGEHKNGEARLVIDVSDIRPRGELLKEKICSSSTKSSLIG
jgi:adenosylcobalamin-dependent ribonucleoside-triphosphate reductase